MENRERKILPEKTLYRVPGTRLELEVSGQKSGLFSTVFPAKDTENGNLFAAKTMPDFGKTFPHFPFFEAENPALTALQDQSRTPKSRFACLQQLEFEFQTLQRLEALPNAPTQHFMRAEKFIRLPEENALALYEFLDPEQYVSLMRLNAGDESDNSQQKKMEFLQPTRPTIPQWEIVTEQEKSIKKESILFYSERVERINQQIQLTETLIAQIRESIKNELDFLEILETEFESWQSPLDMQKYILSQLQEELSPKQIQELSQKNRRILSLFQEKMNLLALEEKIHGFREKLEEINWEIDQPIKIIETQEEELHFPNHSHSVVREIVAQLATIADWLVQNESAHLDLGTQNILVTKEKNAVRVVLIDFGINQNTIRHMYTLREPFSSGLPPVASRPPERNAENREYLRHLQNNSNESSKDFFARAEVYSVAAAMYALLAGKRLFLGNEKNYHDSLKNFQENGQPSHWVRFHHFGQLPAALRVKGFSETQIDGICTVLQKALNLDPQNRYANCSEFSQALLEFIPEGQQNLR